MAQMRFGDRREAGRRLANVLDAYADRDDVVVLALPQGGVPVALEVAALLHAPLDLLVVGKLRVPGHEELALGAVAPGGALVLNEERLREFAIPPASLERMISRERQDLARRERIYRAGRPWPRLKGKALILIDDGVATGATMRAAVTALRRQGPARMVAAAPVVSAQGARRLAGVADELIAVSTPSPFISVAHSYEDFARTTDNEVNVLLAHCWYELPAQRWGGEQRNAL